MQGDLYSEENRGLIPRTIDYIFWRTEDLKDVSISFEYVELYNERINDLIDPNNANLPLKLDSAAKNVVIQGLRSVTVNSPEQLTDCFLRAEKNRTVGKTKSNAQSSRSHSIFILNFRSEAEDGARQGKLYLVDLAGSETVKKTEAEGTRFEEAKFINLSLSALSRVIAALTENDKYIPYNDSKLTRILKNSLGGNSLTTIVINGSPSAYNEKETLSTLRFGNNAKMIKTEAIANTESSVKQLLKKIENLEKQLAATDCVDVKVQSKDCEWCRQLNTRLVNSHIEYCQLDEEINELKEENSFLSNQVEEKQRENHALRAELLEQELFVKEDVERNEKIRLNMINYLNKKEIELNDWFVLKDELEEKVNGPIIKRLKQMLGNHKRELLGLLNKLEFDGEFDVTREQRARIEKLEKELINERKKVNKTAEKEKEEVINLLSAKMQEKMEEIDELKESSLKDLMAKQEKIMSLVEKMGDMEYENELLKRTVKDNDKKNLIEGIGVLRKDNINMINKINALKEQLKEQEKEIEDLKFKLRNTNLKQLFCK